MVAPSQFTSVDVTAVTVPAAAAGGVDKRRELTRTAAETDAPGQSICLDELVPVLEDPADDWVDTLSAAGHSVPDCASSGLKDDMQRFFYEID